MFPEEDALDKLDGRKKAALADDEHDVFFDALVVDRVVDPLVDRF